MYEQHLPPLTGLSPASIMQSIPPRGLEQPTEVSSPVVLLMDVASLSESCPIKQSIGVSALGCC